jgi:2-furoyl-CoA dehydrogenase large subunit
VSDLLTPATLHVGLVTSPLPHAEILSIDTRAALELPGVVAVLTGDELAAETDPLRQYLDVPEVQWRPLAHGHTRYAGEWIAAVVADSRAIAEDGADLVHVEYRELPFVIDPEEAARDGSPLVHPTHGTNIMTRRNFAWGDVGANRGRATRSTSVRSRWNRNSTVPLETFGVIAEWDANRELLDVWASIQMPQFPDQVAGALRVPSNHVRVHFDVDVGGSYGVKRGIKHGVLASYLARRLGRRVALIEDRSENMHGGDFHGPDRTFEVELFYTDDGEFTHIRIDVLDDEGAYPGRSPLQLAKPIGAIVGPYRISSAEYNALAVVTNKTGQVAVRGFGQSPTNFAIEAAVDAVARDLGMDRRDLRRRNFIQPNEFPYLIPSGSQYDSGDYPAVLADAEQLADIDDLIAERDALRAKGRLAGIGIATCLEPGGGNAIFENLMNPKNDKTTFPEACRIRIDGQGEVTAIISISSSGQAHETMVSTVVGEELGIEPQKIAVIRADSLSGFPSQSPVGSRMTIVLGQALTNAAAELRERFRAIGAHRLGLDPGDVEYRSGDVVSLTDDTQSIPFSEIVAIAHRKQHLMPKGIQPGLEVVNVAHTPRSGTLAQSDGTVQLYPTYSFEVHVILADIDPETGKVELPKYFIAHDSGTVFNPDVVRGMVYGGTAHGIGVALYEQFAFNADGQPLTQSFMDYLLPSAHEVPQIKDTERATPSPFTSHGQKGAGESGYMGAPAAVAGAVNDALDYIGATPIHSLPIKPSDIWAAVRAVSTEGATRS